MNDHQYFATRRALFAEKMQSGVAIISTAPEQLRNRDAHYPYRFDSYFYYLTGFMEPEAVLVSLREQLIQLREIYYFVVKKTVNVRYGMVFVMARMRPKRSLVLMKLMLYLN